MKTTPKGRSSGFTLIEALITISIASILASIAIPSFTKMIESNRISAASNDFLSALMYARSEAAKRSMSVSVCTSNDGASCNSSLNDYAAGWIIFTDCDDSGTLSLAATTCDLDGDGTNDSFKGKGVLPGISNFRFMIWNRWGEPMFETDDPFMSWNCRKNNTGQEAPAGVYLVVATFRDPRGEPVERKGYVTLIR